MGRPIGVDMARVCFHLVILLTCGVLAVPLALAAQSLSITERWAIHGADVDWSAVGWIAPRRDGAAALLQATDGKFVVITPQGREGVSVGRRGAGPGEFMTLHRAGWVGDTIWVSDPRNTRLSWLIPGRGVVRERPIPTAVGRPRNASGGDKVLSLSTSVLAPLAGSGMILAVTPANVPQPAWLGKVDSASRLVVSVDGEGRMVRRIAEIGSSPCFAPIVVKGQPGVSRIPFCQDPIIDASADGRTVIALVHAIAGTAELMVYGSDGQMIARRAFPEPGAVISRTAHDSARAAIAARPVPGIADWARRTLRMPERHPAWRDVVVGTDGTIWLERGSPDAQREWHLFDRELRPLGSVKIPLNVAIRAGHRSALWGVRVEEDGLESLIRYDVGERR